MKISIITVSYNSVGTIKDTIESVLNQTYSNIEYIIIDGGSTDGTLQVLKDYEDRIHKIVSEQDNGIYDAMNKGINLASGDIVGILNSDDLYTDNDILSEIMSKFSSDNNLDVLYGNLVYVDKLNVSFVRRRWISCQYYKNFFEDGNVPPHPTLFVRRKVYNFTGLFDLNFNFAADYEFMLRLFKKHSFKSTYLNKIIVKMRLGGTTNNSIGNIIRGNIEILQSWKINDLRLPIFLVPKRFIKKIIQFF